MAPAASAAVLAAALLIALAVVLSVVAVAAIIRLRVALASRSGRRVLGVLHPYANDGGGGERVLWVALRELVDRELLVGWRVVVYTGDAATPDQIRDHAARRFGVAIPAQVEFVYLRSRAAVEPSCYPVATLLGQAVGSLLMAAEAVARAPPTVLLDTSGYGFCYALVKALGVSKERRDPICIFFPLEPPPAIRRCSATGRLLRALPNPLLAFPHSERPPLRCSIASRFLPVECHPLLAFPHPRPPAPPSAALPQVGCHVHYPMVFLPSPTLKATLSAALPQVGC
jgi:hypothetical protein